jgi:hypothetical protein
MAKAGEPVEVVSDEPWRVLTSALADLEAQAVARARELVSVETKAMLERIAAVETALKASLSAPKPPPEIATKASAKPVAPVREPLLSPERPIEELVRTSKKGLPPLPARLSIASLQQYLDGLGFQLVDHRYDGGGIWVYHGQEDFGHVAEHLKKHGIGVQRYRHGRRRRSGDQYAIDPYKVLPDK